MLIVYPLVRLWPVCHHGLSMLQIGHIGRTFWGNACICLQIDQWFPEVLLAMIGMKMEQPLGDPMLFIPIMTGTRYTGGNLKGSWSRMVAVGIIPMVRPVDDDLMAILIQLAESAGLPSSQICQSAKLLICEVAEGNYRLFVNAVLTACGIRDENQDVLSQGSHAHDPCSALWVCRLKTQPCAHIMLKMMHL